MAKQIPNDDDLSPHAQLRRALDHLEEILFSLHDCTERDKVALARQQVESAWDTLAERKSLPPRK